MAHFPKLLSSQVAFDMAQTLVDGFNRHYRIFREASKEAKNRFEAMDWSGVRQLLKDRIDYYDTRVKETIIILEDEYDAINLEDEVWQQVKLHYIGLLTDHHQPELAETFFNSVFTRIMSRSYFHNDFIFLRPTISTEYIENDEPISSPTYKAYYPGNLDGLHQTFHDIVASHHLNTPFDDLDRDIEFVCRGIKEELGGSEIRTNFQVHVLTSLFFRNKAAYVIGRVINGDRMYPLAIPILHDKNKKLRLDAVLLDPDDFVVIFSFTHSYFLVDMEVPSAYVTFLRSLMPNKPRAEIYNTLGLQKHGKNLFYRDFQHHLQHSTDKFRISPGIKGLVMLVFDLPSYPYVFKIIKDYFPPPKETTRELIQSKYLLVKQHDRVGRMADTLEFSSVAFPLNRFDPELLEELNKHVASQLEFGKDSNGEDELVLKHLYIERRMTPLNIYLQNGTDAQVEHGIIEYGNAIKELIAANIFPGDMLYKNFGVTRHARVVFYDYDEIEYLTDCNIRKVPVPRNEEDELSGEVWYNVGPHDIFPETYNTFLLGDERVRKYFLMHHADFFDPTMWQSYKDKLVSNQTHDFYAYNQKLRFVNRYAK